MSEARRDKDEAVVANGLDGATGRYLLPPLTREQLGRVATQIDPDGELRQLLLDWSEGKAVRDPFRAPSSDVQDPTDLAETGWGVIFAEGTPSSVRRALEPLLTMRESRAKELYFDLNHQNGDSHQQFMAKIGVRPGPRVVPEKLPYYLLLVGDPAKMSFRFQSELDVQYAVGRLHFDSEDPKDPDASQAYAAYANAVVAAEEGRARRREAISFFSVENPGDEGTRRLAGELVEPLVDVLKRGRSSWTTDVIAAPSSTRDRLGRLLLGGSEERPSILFTTSHGVGFPRGDERQFKAQGALVCQDWPGPSQPLERNHYFTAAEVPAEVDLSGLISFQVSCYSAGTPQLDDFGRIQGAQSEIAPYPFVARLPQKLLERGALAVIGHIDRAWTSSFSWNGEGGHVQVYSEVLKQLMDGLPVGWAMEAMGSYFGAQAASLHGMRDDLQFFRSQDFEIYADLWRETNDARNFVVLGDPAVRLNFDR